MKRHVLVPLVVAFGVGMIALGGAKVLGEEGGSRLEQERDQADVH